MGSAIAEWFGEQEGLTRQSLEVMMTRIRADLRQIKLTAEEEGDDEHWASRVSGPLRLTGAGLIEAIDRQFQVARAQVREAGSGLEQALKVFHAVDASYTVLNEKVESFRQDLARTGEDGSPQRLDETAREKDEARQKIAAVQAAERKLFGDLSGAEKDVESAERSVASARETRKAGLEALWP